VSESVHPKKLVMYRKSIVTKALVAIVMVCVLGCDKKVAEAGPPTPPEVFVTQVVSADVPTIRGWVGTLDGSEKADIRARVTGSLQKRDYQERSFVKEGDLLFEIDSRPFEAALAEAKSELTQV
jgi:multidrug efflux pump subunit AcrA (membrane-fusion protein)